VIAVVITADDFGSALEVNEAVEIAHCDGILTAASLMVAAPHAADAVARALRLPELGVGLHVVLVDGRPILPARDVPDLVDDRGLFRSNMFVAGVRFALSARVRRQLRAEVDAQFAAFAATGLAFDHVNAHKHFHVHPVVREIVLQAAQRHGAKMVRSPLTDGSLRGAGWITRPFARALARRAVRYGLATPDRVFGLAESGAFDAGRLQAAIRATSEGLNEIYLHPASVDDFSGSTPGYRHRDELNGLLSRDVRAAVRSRRINLGNFAAFA